MIGKQIENFRLEELLGEGTYGAVYRAAHLVHPQRKVAIKVVRPHLAGSRAFVGALRQECSAISELVHPGIARFRELIIDGQNPPAIVMELLRGDTLQTELTGGALPLEKTVPILGVTLEALGHAHDAGIVHQDIKPANLFLCSDGAVKILGFGLARAADSGRATSTGQFEGALDYLAPEVFEGLQVGAPADIYATGLIAWEMLVGQPACAKGPLGAKMGWHLGVDLPDVRTLRPDCPAWLAKVVALLTDKDASRRPRSGTAAADVLRLQMKKGGGLSSLTTKERGQRSLPPRTVRIDRDSLPEPMFPGQGLADGQEHGAMAGPQGGADCSTKRHPRGRYDGPPQLEAMARWTQLLEGNEEGGADCDTGDPGRYGYGFEKATAGVVPEPVQPPPPPPPPLDPPQPKPEPKPEPEPEPEPTRPEPSEPSPDEIEAASELSAKEKAAIANELVQQIKAGGTKTEQVDPPVDPPVEPDRPEAPQAYRSAGTLITVAAALSLVFSLAWIFVFFGLLTGAATVPTLIIGLKVRKGEPQDRAVLAAAGGLFVALFCLNIPGMVLCALAWIRLKKPEVVEWMEGR